MDRLPFLELAHNIALLLAIALLFDVAGFRQRVSQASYRQILFGFLLGAIGIALMLTPWTFTPGIIFDTRSVLLSMSGLFFGLIPTLIAMLITGVFRLVQGGAAALTGVSVILVTGTLGIAWRHLRRKSLAEVSWGELYLFGLINHLIMLLLMFTLPLDIALQVLANISLPVIVIYPIGSVLLGLLMVNRLKREQMIEDLRVSEEKLRLVGSSANIGYFDRNLITDREIYSSEWKRQIGYADHEISDDIDEWKSRVHPDDLAAVLARVNACIQNHQPLYEAEYRLRHKTGGYRWILSRGLLYFNAEGQATRLLGCHIDITRQKEIDEAVLASERRFRNLAESSQDYIMLYDQECRHVYLNPASLRVSGLNEEDIIGKTHREAGFDEQMSETWKSDIQQVFSTRKSSQRLFQWESAEGFVYLEWRLSPVLGADGSVELVLGISRDVTERKRSEKALRQSEENYRQIFEQAADGIFIVDAQGKLLDANPSACALLGYPREEILQLSITDLIPPKDQEQVPARIAEINAGNPIVSEQRMRRKHGSLIDVEINTRRLSDGRSQGMLRDITYRKIVEKKAQEYQTEMLRLLAEADQSRRVLLDLVENQRKSEEQIRKLNAELDRRVHDRTVQLEAANQELEAFSYSVSHDLRAPLRAMDGFSKALLEDYSDNLNNQGKHYLNRIQEGAAQMSQLINDLLDLSRVTRVEIKRQQVNMSTLASEIVQNLKSQNPERQVKIDISPNLTVDGDAFLLRIVMENLLGNAFKFTNQRALAEISVSLTERQGEKVFYVRDNGVGFKMEYANKLFAPFQRLHSSNEFPGTGIGLATVQRIITRHGGRIWSEAAENQGATFFFTLG